MMSSGYGRGVLAIVSGPSGAGKGTVVAAFFKANPRANVFLSISATTRAPRAGEVDGTHYFFKTRREFEKMIAADALIEHTRYAENYYGTPAAAVDERLDRGESVLLEIEMDGAMQVKHARPDAALIFVIPPTWERLEHQLRRRGTEDEATIRRRLDIAREEILGAGKYNYIVINDTVETAAEELGAIITAERCHSHRRVGEVARAFEISAKPRD